MFAKTLMLFSLALGSAVGLIGCGRGDQTPPSNTPSSNTAGHGAAGVTGALQITSWGPDRTKTGVAFNSQPDGSSALWVRLNRTLSGGTVSVDFNGHPLAAVVQGELVTVSVPTSLYATPGTYALHVTVKQGAATVQSNDVKFVVE
jgi:hypothetical protein